MLESSEKNGNDRTWSFWEKGAGCFDAVVHRKWTKAAFVVAQGMLDLTLAPYAYKSVRSIDFYAYAFSRLRLNSNVATVRATVTDIAEGEPVCIQTAEGKMYRAGLVFDSRIPEAYFAAINTSPAVLQHFKGWLVETAVPAFDPDRFTMMDFSVRLPV